MTALNFPDSPSNGATYQGYTYSSAKGTWSKPAVTDARTAVYANIAALPTSGTAGDMAFVTATNRLYLWTGTGWYNIALINNNPTISGVNATYNLAIDGTATTVTITATDPEGLPITYSIVSDTSGNTATVTQGTGASTNVFTITPSTNTAHAGTFSLTFRASDGVNIASAAASFTLQFTVQNSKYTSSLITSVGANNAVNTAFDDKSTSNHTITANGNVTQTTFSPYRHGGYSAYFDGTGDSLNTTATQVIPTSSFTVTAWVYLNDLTNAAVWGQGTAGHSGRTAITVDANKWFVQIGGNYAHTSAVAANQWYYVDFQWDGSNIKFFVDGTLVYTISATNTPTNSAFYIGDLGSSWSNNYPLNGYVSDLRVVSGTPAGSSTVPTGRLTAITNTSLLACHLPYFADGSTNGHAITANGNVSTKPFAPYDEQEYSASSHLGSAEFDGTGDYLASDNNNIGNFGTGDFTVEGWFRVPDRSALYTVVDGRPTTLTSASGWSVAINTSGGLYVYSGGFHISGTNGDVTTNAWHHWALSRESGAMKLFLNGVQQGSTNSTARDYTANLFRVGASGTGGEVFKGNQADVRVVKGTAVYTANFTPPTAPLSAITNTSFLLHNTDAGIIDKAQRAQDLRLFGNTKSSTTQNKFLTSSMYFDGTGDYLKWTNTEAVDYGIGGEPFTLEWWQWWPSIVDSRSLGPQTGGTTAGWNGTSGHQWTMFTYSSSATLFMQWWNGSGRTDYELNHGGALTASTWQHFAIVYDGTNLSNYVDGTRIGHRTSGNTFGAVTNRFAVLGGNTAGTGQSEIYYSDVRITKGLARYSGTSLTVPTAALKG